MKKFKLFSLLMLLFACVTGMWGADTKIIVFTTGSASSSTAASINAASSDDIATLSSTYCYARDYGMFVSSNNNPGTATLTMKAAGQVKATKIVTSICGTLDKAISIEVTYMDDTKSTKTSLGTTAGDIETNLDNSKAIKSIQYTAVKASKASISQLVIHLVPSTPTITATPDSIGFGVKNIYNNDAAKSGSTTIKISGVNLTADISAALDKGTIFTLPESSLDKASKDADFTVNYSVSAIGSYDDTLRLTSTSADEVKIPITLKVISELQLIDTLTRATTGVTGYSYSAFAEKGANLDAEYSGVCAGSYSSIQLRNNADNSGLVSTFSDGFVRKVAIVWDSQTSNGRYVEIYGSNTAYTGSADLYDYDTDGTLLGTIKKGESTELEIEEDYKYIGFLANNTLYMDTIFVTWAPVADKPAVSYSAPTGGTLTVRKKAILDEERIVANGDQVAEGKKLVVTATPNGTTHMGGTIVAYKTGDPSTEVTITDGELTMPDYPITIAATFDPRPRVEISPKSLDFGTKIEQGDVEAGQTFVISGEDLTGALTVTMPNAAYSYEVTDGTLTPENGSVLAEITVTPVTTEFGNFNGKININGGGLAADTAQVDVKMTIIAKSAVTITPPANGTISVKNAADEDIASGAKIVVGKRMKVTVAPNDEKTHRETLKIYKTGDVNTTISVDANDSITMPDYPITITADEVVLYTVALDVKEDGAAASHGTSATMNGGTADVYKAASETVALTATRVTGYQFVNWTASTEDITFANAENTSTIATIKGAGSITANFQAVPELLVSVTALDLGYAKLNGSLDAKTFTISGESLEEGNLTLTLDEAIKDAFEVSDATVAVDGTLAPKTITVTPITTKAGNYSGNLTISGGGLDPVKTVALSSVIEQTYTVTWMVNGVAAKTTTDIATTALVAPSVGEITGKMFMGWTDAVIDGKTDTKPTMVELTTMPAKDTTLYALYASQHSEDQVQEFSYTFRASDFGTSGYSSVNNVEITATCTSDNQKTVKVAYSTVNIMNSSSMIQGKASSGKIFNTTPWGKGIKSVDITNGGAGSNFNKGIGSTEKPTSVGTGGYFQVYAGGSYCTASNVEVTFDSTINVTTYDAYITNAYEVTFDDPSNGTLVVENGEDAVATGDKVAAGTTLTVTATPDEGFVIDEAIKVLKVGDDEDVTESVLSGSTLTMPAYAIKLSVSFKQQGGGTGVDNIHGDNIPTTKVLRDNQIYILRGDKTYTIDGQLVK